MCTEIHVDNHTIQSNEAILSDMIEAMATDAACAEWGDLPDHPRRTPLWRVGATDDAEKLFRQHKVWGAPHNKCHKAKTKKDAKWVVAALQETFDEVDINASKGVYVFAYIKTPASEEAFDALEESEAQRKTKTRRFWITVIVSLIVAGITVYVQTTT